MRGATDIWCNMRNPPPLAQSEEIRQGRADIQQLVEQHNALCDECDALDVTKTTLEADIVQLQTQHTALHLELKFVQDSIPIASEELQCARDEQETAANERLQDLLFAIDTRIAQQHDLEMQHDKLRMDCTSSAQEHGRMLEDMSKTQAGLQTLHAKHTDTTLALESLQTQHTAHMETCSADNKVLHETKVHMLDAVADIKASITQMNAQKTKTHDDLTQMQTSLASHTASHATAVATSALLAQKNAAHEEELAACILAIVEKNAACAAVHARVEQARDMHAHLELEYKERHDESEQQRNISALEHEQLQTELKSSRILLAECVSAVSGRKSEISEIEARTVDQQNIVNAAADQKLAELLELDAALQQMSTAVAKTRTECTVSSDMLAGLQIELQDMQGCLSTHTSSVAGKQSELLALEKKIQHFQHEAAQQQTTTESEVASLHQQRASAEAALETSCCAVAETRAELTRLQADMHQQQQHLAEQHNVLSEKCVDLSKKRAECESDLRTMRDELTRCTTEMQELRELRQTEGRKQHKPVAIHPATLQKTPSNSLSPENQDADDEFEAMLLSISDAETMQNTEAENTPHDTTHCQEAPAIDVTQASMAAERESAYADLLQQISAAQDELRKEQTDLACTRQHIADIALQQSALDEERNCMSVRMDDMQQEIDSRQEESEVLASNIASQHIALQEASNAILEVETSKKLAMEEELCALEVRIGMQQTALETQKNSMLVRMDDMQQEIDGQHEESEILARNIATQQIALQEATDAILEVETDKKIAMQAELCALEVDIGMRQTALDTQKNSMSTTMHDMQQEINSQQEESITLASTIATQQIALQEATDAILEVETSKKLAMQEELCALEVSISMQQTALDTQKNSMSTTMHDMQQEINSQQEESEILASNIATQQIALQEATDAILEVEGNTKLAMQEELHALHASVGMQQSALDTQKDSMSATMRDMQQEISFQQGESDRLASDITSQRRTLQEAKDATSEFETSTKLVMQEELCALQTSLAFEHEALDTQRKCMSDMIQDMQHEIDSRHGESELLSSSIENQHIALQEAKDATSAVETDTKLAMQEELGALQASIVGAQERYTKLQKDTQKKEKQSTKSNDALTKTRNSLNDEVTQASGMLQSTQLDLEETVQAVATEHMEQARLVAERETETAQYSATSAQQKAQLDEMQANVDCMLQNEQKIMQNIELLSLSHDDYTQKLDKIQCYSNGLHTAMLQLRNSVNLQKNSPEFHVCMETILDLFGNFLDWFETSFTHKLHILTCLLLNSRIE